MGKAVELREVKIAELKPYARNAKQHSKEQVDKIAESIRRLGFISPCLIDREHNVIAGHGRIMAAKQIGRDAVPCIFVEGLTEEERKAYILADNRLTELGEWNMDLVQQELAALADADFDVSLTGFDVDVNFDWFSREEKDGNRRQEGNEAYNDFLEKFEQKKTTDDCYTPDNVYEAVADWVAEEYGLDRAKFVRPFYPGGDYQKEKYPEGSVVVDNPPFSILSEIIKWYNKNGVRFFLFAPALTLFTAIGEDVEYLPVGASILYENGAEIATSFVNNIGKFRVYVSHELYEKIKEQNDKNYKVQHKELPKYKYPDEVITAGIIQRLAKNGQTLRIPKDECIYKNTLDSQREAGKNAYGGLFLISERVAAERTAAEQAATERSTAAQREAEEMSIAERNAQKDFVWKLSEKEKEIVKSLGRAEPLEINGYTTGGGNRIAA